MIWLIPLGAFIALSSHIMVYSMEIYHWMWVTSWDTGIDRWMRVVFYEERVERLLSYLFLFFWVTLIPKFFPDVLHSSAYNQKLLFIHFSFTWVAMLVICYIIWSILFWLNLNMFVDYSVYTINLFLIFFFNFIYSVFFKLSNLEKKIVNLLA